MSPREIKIDKLKTQLSMKRNWVKLGQSCMDFKLPPEVEVICIHKVVYDFCKS